MAENWREWLYLGAPLTPNALNGGKAPFPKFQNVHSEPWPYEHFRRTGAFAEAEHVEDRLRIG
jgi:hypothetical protein